MSTAKDLVYLPAAPLACDTEALLLPGCPRGVLGVSSKYLSPLREQRSELLVQEEEELRRGCNGPVNQHECFSLASHRSEEDSSERRSPSRLAILGNSEPPCFIRFCLAPQLSVFMNTCTDLQPELASNVNTAIY